jgi:uncharacterized MAPEG superfamily protein
MLLLRTYALTTIVLALKMFAIAVVQGRGRVKASVFVNPEDARLFSGQLGREEAPTVQRASAAWRNDIENIPIFLILAWIYVSAPGLSHRAFDIYCMVFVAARILHTFFYLNALQPWRTIAYTVGFLATLALMIHLLVGVAFA